VARHAARDPGLIVSRPAAATPDAAVSSQPAGRLAAVALLMV
jgi:hypothetical protein